MAEIEGRKAALIAELSRARAEMGRHSTGFRAGPKVGQRVNQGISRHRKIWLAGAALLGLILGRVPPRTQKVPLRAMTTKEKEQYARFGKAGFFVGILKILIDLAKPLLLAWATKRIGDVAQSAKKAEHKADRAEQKSDRAERKSDRVQKATAAAGEV